MEAVFRAQHASLPDCLYVHTRGENIFESMKQLISGVEGVRVCMRPHLVQHAGFPENNGVTATIAVEGLVLHVALQNTGCIICMLAKKRSPKSGVLATDIKQ